MCTYEKHMDISQCGLILLSRSTNHEQEQSRVGGSLVHTTELTSIHSI